MCTVCIFFFHTVFFYWCFPAFLTVNARWRVSVHSMVAIRTQVTFKVNERVFSRRLEKDNRGRSSACFCFFYRLHISFRFLWEKRQNGSTNHATFLFVLYCSIGNFFWLLGDFCFLVSCLEQLRTKGEAGWRASSEGRTVAQDRCRGCANRTFPRPFFDRFISGLDLWQWRFRWRSRWLGGKMETKLVYCTCISFLWFSSFLRNRKAT